MIDLSLMLTGAPTTTLPGTPTPSGDAAHAGDAFAELLGALIAETGLPGSVDGELPVEAAASPPAPQPAFCFTPAVTESPLPTVLSPELPMGLIAQAPDDSPVPVPADERDPMANALDAAAGCAAVARVALGLPTPHPLPVLPLAPSLPSLPATADTNANATEKAQIPTDVLAAAPGFARRPEAATTGLGHPVAATPGQSSVALASPATPEPGGHAVGRTGVMPSLPPQAHAVLPSPTGIARRFPAPTGDVASIVPPAETATTPVVPDMPIAPTPAVAESPDATATDTAPDTATEVASPELAANSGQWSELAANLGQPIATATPPAPVGPPVPAPAADRVAPQLDAAMAPMPDIARQPVAATISEPTLVAATSGQSMPPLAAPATPAAPVDAPVLDAVDHLINQIKAEVTAVVNESISPAPEGRTAILPQPLQISTEQVAVDATLTTAAAATPLESDPLMPTTPELQQPTEHLADAAVQEATVEATEVTLEMVDAEPLHAPMPPNAEVAVASNTSTTANTSPRTLTDREEATVRSVAEPLREMLRDLPRARSNNLSLTVRLDPPELGMVRLHVVAHGDTVNVTLHADSPEARNALADRQFDIATVLRQDGFSLDGFDIRGHDNRRREDVPQQARRRDGEQAPDEPTAPQPDDGDLRL